MGQLGIISGAEQLCLLLHLLAPTGNQGRLDWDAITTTNLRPRDLAQRPLSKSVNISRKLLMPICVYFPVVVPAVGVSDRV